MIKKVLKNLVFVSGVLGTVALVILIVISTLKLKAVETQDVVQPLPTMQQYIQQQSDVLFKSEAFQKEMKDEAYKRSAGAASGKSLQIYQDAVAK